MEVRFTQRLLSTNISQGSVTTRLRRGWIFNYRFSINLLLSLSVKRFENRLAFGKVRAKNRVASFFRTRCIINLSFAISEVPDELKMSKSFQSIKRKKENYQKTINPFRY